jgi:hypothetical protein
MSGGTIKGGNVQIGNDGTASNNFTIYQPAVADGTSRWAVGVAGATTKDMITVSGTNITLGGNLVQAATAAPSFSAYKTSTQAISSAVWTKITLDSEEWDTNNNFDSTTNYRFTPTVAGYYQISGSFSTEPSSGTQTRTLCGIYKNGSEWKIGMDTNGTTSRNNGMISVMIYMNGSTDYVELWAYVSGGSPSIRGTQGSTWFQGFLARSA